VCAEDACNNTGPTLGTHRIFFYFSVLKLCEPGEDAEKSLSFDGACEKTFLVALSILLVNHNYSYA
jgi:hypothetical protein